MERDQKKKFYITTPIYYPSDKLHIGHTYCTVFYKFLYFFATADILRNQNFIKSVHFTFLSA